LGSQRKNPAARVGAGGGPSSRSLPVPALCSFFTAGREFRPNHREPRFAIGEATRYRSSEILNYEGDEPFDGLFDDRIPAESRILTILPNCLLKSIPRERIAGEPEGDLCPRAPGHQLGSRQPPGVQHRRQIAAASGHLATIGVEGLGEVGVWRAIPR
jgi:hypothetical protein